jgi:hypothetical protein
MRSTLYGIHTVDLESFAAVALTLLVVAVVASYVPARSLSQSRPHDRPPPELMTTMARSKIPGEHN